jgi:hypothetical protein
VRGALEPAQAAERDQRDSGRPGRHERTEPHVKRRRTLNACGGTDLVAYLYQSASFIRVRPVRARRCGPGRRPPPP